MIKACFFFFLSFFFLRQSVSVLSQNTYLTHILCTPYMYTRTYIHTCACIHAGPLLQLMDNDGNAASMQHMQVNGRGYTFVMSPVQRLSGGDRQTNYLLRSRYIHVRDILSCKDSNRLPPLADEKRCRFAAGSRNTSTWLLNDFDEACGAVKCPLLRTSGDC